MNNSVGGRSPGVPKAAALLHQSWLLVRPHVADNAAAPVSFDHDEYLKSELRQLQMVAECPPKARPTSSRWVTYVYFDLQCHRPLSLIVADVWCTGHTARHQRTNLFIHLLLHHQTHNEMISIDGCYYILHNSGRGVIMVWTVQLLASDSSRGQRASIGHVMPAVTPAAARFSKHGQLAGHAHCLEATATLL